MEISIFKQLLFQALEKTKSLLENKDERIIIEILEAAANAKVSLEESVGEMGAQMWTFET